MICPVCEQVFSPVADEQKACSFVCSLKFYEMMARVNWGMMVVARHQMPLEPEKTAPCHASKVENPEPPDPEKSKPVVSHEGHRQVVSRFVDECILHTGNRKHRIRKALLFAVAKEWGVKNGVDVPTRQIFYTNLPRAWANNVVKDIGNQFYRGITWLEVGRKFAQECENRRLSKKQGTVVQAMGIFTGSVEELRENEGLPPAKPGIRKCLYCDRPFHSADVTVNRICDSCRGLPSRNSVDEQELPNITIPE